MPELADADSLGMDILRAALGDDATVVEELPPDWVAEYPTVVGYRIPGGRAVHPEFLDRALYQVDVYHNDRGAALDLARRCRTALYEAWRSQTQFPHGSISDFDETSAPAVVWTPNQPAGERFVPATYQLHVCP